MANKLEKIVPEDIFESGDLKILICYMLTALGEPLPATELSQLFHYEGIANYFDTQTAIDNLQKDGYIKETSKDMFMADDKGIDLSNTLKDSVSAVLRTKVYNAVVKMLTRYKAERDTDLTITKCQSGYTLTYKVMGGEDAMLSFSITLPNMSQANELKDKILKDPKYYCDSFINLLTEDISFKDKEK